MLAGKRRSEFRQRLRNKGSDDSSPIFLNLPTARAKTSYGLSLYEVSEKLSNARLNALEPRDESL